MRRETQTDGRKNLGGVLPSSLSGGPSYLCPPLRHHARSPRLRALEPATAPKADNGWVLAFVGAPIFFISFHLLWALFDRAAFTLPSC